METCTVSSTLDIVGKKWALLIILSINKGGTSKKRFSQIKSELKGITSKILSFKLKELEDFGLIRKQIDSRFMPAKTYYSLTESGKDLLNIIKDIKGWGLKWKFKNKLCSSTSCRNCI